ncbi:MAG: glycosyltransferase family 2 protein [Lachnospiraceae bacterium]|nr:glycosyltransferase family 2 protein [Lachnospiraceae bacterium]
MKKVSVIVPCFNEEETIDLFYKTITSFWKESLSDHELELVLVDDGSKDSTYEKMISLAKADPSVRYGSFSRNFGKEAAMFAGLDLCTGDCAVVIDADLQHPVETIKKMVSKWDEGFEVIEGIKASRGKEARSHGLFAGLFYKIISSLVGFDMQNSSDFKLIDRKVIDVLRSFTEKDTFFRALTFWTGFKSTSVEYEVKDRAAGVSKWSGFSLVKYALRNIIAFTYTPLYLIAFLGIVVIIIGVILGIDAIVTYFMGEAVGGYPSLVILITLSTGAILSSLGIISVYMSKMFNEVKNRPRYIFRDHN